MIVNCDACIEGTATDGNPCEICGGDGEIDLTDPLFHKISLGTEKILRGRVWSDILTKFDALDTKLDTLDAHLDTIETKIDAL